MKPRCLDLFCCGGGAGTGYARAGYEVVGVDIEPQPNYPFRFIQADAIDFLKTANGFNLIHASPPCQGYSSHVTSRSSQWVPTKGADEPMLIDAVRDLVSRKGCDWVIENVMGGAVAHAGNAHAFRPDVRPTYSAQAAL